MKIVGDVLPATAVPGGDRLGVPTLGEYFVERLGEGGCVVIRDQASGGLVHLFGNASVVGRDDGPAGGECFEHDVGAAFAVAGQGDEVGGGHPLGHSLGRAGGDERDLGGDVVAGNGGGEDSFVGAVADDVTAGGWTALAQLGYGFDELDQALAEVEAADVNDDLGRGVERERLAGFDAVARMKDGRVAAVQDGLGAVCRSAEADGCPAEVVADGGGSVGVAKSEAGEGGDEAITHAVEVGADGGEDYRQPQGAGDAQRGESIGVDHIVEDQVRCEGADGGEQAPAHDPAIERT